MPLPVRRAALRAAGRPRGVRQRRRRRLLPGADFLAASPATSTGSGCARSTRGSTSTRCCEALAAVDGVCAGDVPRAARRRPPIGTRFGFVKAPRSTVRAARPGARRHHRRPRRRARAPAGPARPLTCLPLTAGSALLAECDHRVDRADLHGCPDTRRISLTGDPASDRPRPAARLQPAGYGSSTVRPRPRRRARVGAELLDVGAIPEVAVLGISVGGPYAAAFAATYPGRTTALGWSRPRRRR